MKDQVVDPHVFIIFGGTGDLARRMLVPALFRLATRGVLPPNCITLVASRGAGLNDQAIRAMARRAIHEAGIKADEHAEAWCERCLYFQPWSADDPETYQRLASRIVDLEAEHGIPGNRLFYLALPPAAFPTTVEGLGRAVASLAQEAVDQKGRFTIALSGGETPRRLYTILAQDYRDRVPWQGVHLLWGDERFVPPEHRLNNYRMAWETLLEHVPMPPPNIHPVPTTAPTPEEAARAYEAELLRWFGSFPPSFDLALLGLGADGHVASLFPGSRALY